MAVSTLLLSLMCLASGGANHDPVSLRPPRHGGVYVVAHRGAHQGLPENSLAAYRKAIDLGVDFIEIDVRTTKDNHFVSIHNSEINRHGRGTSLRVADLTLAEVRAIDLGPAWKGEPIPTFEEILDLCKGRIGIYLDLKDAPVESLIPLIQARSMEHDVLWYAAPRTLDQVKALCPACIVMPDPGPETMLPPLLKRFEPRVVATVWRYHTKNLVDMCHAAGAMVIPDEDFGGVAKDIESGVTPRCWQKALASGADGIQTDWPEALIAFLDKRTR